MAGGVILLPSLRMKGVWKNDPCSSRVTTSRFCPDLGRLDDLDGWHPDATVGPVLAHQPIEQGSDRGQRCRWSPLFGGIIVFSDWRFGCGSLQPQDNYFHDPNYGHAGCSCFGPVDLSPRNTTLAHLRVDSHPGRSNGIRPASAPVSGTKLGSTR